MALDKRLQNPMRSALDPTENNARFAALEKEIVELQDRVAKLERVKLGPARWGGIG